MAIDWKVLLLGAVAYLAYRNRDSFMKKKKKKEAEYTQYEVDGVKVDDYGSLDNPVSVQYMGIGRAAGQSGSEADEATLAMSVAGVGQNFNGRAFGL